MSAAADSVGKLANTLLSHMQELRLRPEDVKHFPIIEQPGEHFFVSVSDHEDQELVKVIRTGEIWDVERAQEGTQACSFGTGAEVRLAMGSYVATPPATDDPVRPRHYKLTLRDVTILVRSQDHPLEGIPGDAQVEVIDVVEALGYQDDAYLATALIYLMRLRRKEQPVVDVKKAIWWLQRWLAAQEETPTP